MEWLWKHQKRTNIGRDIDDGDDARRAAVREAVLRPQNGPDTRPNGFRPPIGPLGSSINEEISQGDVSIEQ